MQCNKRNERKRKYTVGDVFMANTMDGLLKCTVKTVSDRGYWVEAAGSPDVERFVKNEHITDQPVEGTPMSAARLLPACATSEEEDEDMTKKKETKNKPKEKEKANAKPAAEPKKLKDGLADQKTCDHDIVERKLKGDGTFETKGRCHDCGAVLDFTEQGEKKLSPL